MTDDELAAIRADLAVPLHSVPLHEEMTAVYQAHYASLGPAGEHLSIELDERDLDYWIDRASLNHARGMILRGQVAELLTEVERLRHRLQERDELLAELRGVVWTGQFGIPEAETLRLQRAIDTALRDEWAAGEGGNGTNG